MFITDMPIENASEDILDRRNFAEHLGESIYDWNGKDSLVIALNGTWGVGKSSIINMAVQHIENKEEARKPLVIKFNPWIYSNLNDLTKEFFNEISAKLKVSNQSERDKELAATLQRYSNLLSVLPNKSQITENYNQIVILLGLIGVSSSQITELINIDSNIVKWGLFIGGALLLLSQFGKNALDKARAILNGNESENKEATVLEIKESINKELLIRGHKLVIIIDDIDRLTPKEITEVFQLVKINADFKNTVYLLSYDQDVVIKGLEDALHTKGSTYIEKIVQVSFDVPQVQRSLIHRYLIKELESIIKQLPLERETFFNSNRQYWGNIFHSGIKVFFNNIRNVKRFISSLEFNVSQMCSNGVMEVNLIDAIAIESLRIFEPKLLEFIKDNKELFVNVNNTYHREDPKLRKQQLEYGFKLISDSNREPVTELLKNLFPQIQGPLINNNYGSDWLGEWAQNLRVCSPKHFESYFMYIPKGSSEAVSQYELKLFLSNLNDMELIKESFIVYDEAGRLRNLIETLTDYTENKNLIPIKSYKNLIIPMIDLMNKDSMDKAGMFDFGGEWDIIRFIIKLLTRETDFDFNFSLLKMAIEESKYLYGISKIISIESAEDNTRRLVNDIDLSALQILCAEKINKSAEDGSIFKDTNVPYILFRWKEWEKEPAKILAFLNDVIRDDETLIKLLVVFQSSYHTTTIGDYTSIERVKLNFKELNDLVPDASEFKQRLINIKQKNNNLYEQFHFLIEEYLNPKMD